MPCAKSILCCDCVCGAQHYTHGRTPHSRAPLDVFKYQQHCGLTATLRHGAMWRGAPQRNITLYVVLYIKRTPHTHIYIDTASCMTTRPHGSITKAPFACTDSQNRASYTYASRLRCNGTPGWNSDVPGQPSSLHAMTVHTRLTTATALSGFW